MDRKTFRAAESLCIFNAKAVTPGGITFDGYPLCFSEVRQFRPPYLKALNDISQLLQDNGYEAASKFLDCCFDL